MQTTKLYMPEDHMDELYNSKNFLVRYVHNNRLQNIINQFPQDSGLQVLDAGCGEGHLLERLTKKYPNNKYYGADLTTIALQQAKLRLPQGNFLLTDLGKIDLPNSFFDVIVCTETIEHIDDYQSVIKELIRLLKPNGVLILTFPNEFWWTVSRFLLGRRPIKVVDHINFFTIKKI
jgi:2-polyprenyl-3-methyl-5-hydroxy-6-metoxy-1,4-benzoquinol methylase